MTNKKLDKLYKFCEEIWQEACDSFDQRDEYDPVRSEEQGIMDGVVIIQKQIDKLKLEK